MVEIDWVLIIAIAVVSFLVLALIFRKYISALIMDYAVDFMLSSLDVFVMSLPLGDILAAGIILEKERKIVGWWVILPVIDALNYGIGLIPIVGAPVELFSNLFPAIFVTRLLFSKFGKAEKEEKKLEKNIAVGKKLGVSVKNEEKMLEKVKKLLKKEDPLDALKEEKKADKDLLPAIEKHVDGLISDVDAIVESIKKQNIPVSQEQLNVISQGMSECQSLIDQAREAKDDKDFEKAVDLASKARDVIMNAVQMFDNMYQR